jgi:hypothetical protein
MGAIRLLRFSSYIRGLYKGEDEVKFSRFYSGVRSVWISAGTRDWRFRDFLQSL